MSLLHPAIFFPIVKIYQSDDSFDYSSTFSFPDRDSRSDLHNISMPNLWVVSFVMIFFLFTAVGKF